MGDDLDAAVRTAAFAHLVPQQAIHGTVLPRTLLAQGFQLHHPVFDSNVIGIRPDYVVEVRGDVLKEHDGPMLLHGLQGVNKSILTLPNRQEHRPNPAFLEERYELFKKAV